MIKIVFCDMDGTLLDENGQMPPMFDEVIAELKAHNVIFAPSSGRQYSALLKQMGKYIDDFLFLAENGTFVAQHDKELFSNTLKREDIMRVLDAAEQIPGAYPVVCGKRLAFITKQWGPYLEGMDQYFTQSKIVEDLHAAVENEEVIKIAISDAERGHAEKNIYPQLQEAVADPLQVVLSSNYWVDIMNPGVNKGVAVKRVQQMLGLKPEECAAFGDYLNDREMLEAVGYGYAMENAHPDVKKIAKYTAPPNTEYGVMTRLREMMAQGMMG